MRTVAQRTWLKSIHGSRLATSFFAAAICASGSRATPSASARSPPRYQTHWPSAAGWLVTVIRGFGPPPRQWAYSGLRLAPLAMTMCSGRRCMAGWLRPRASSKAALPAPALSTTRWARISRPSTRKPSNSPLSFKGSMVCAASRLSPANSASLLSRLGTSMTSSARR
ncbi:hypothetical protein D9M71_581890 [compost metagenome]